MSPFVTSRNTFTIVWRELRTRARLIAAAFGRNLPPDNRLQASDATGQQHDLLSGLNLAGHTVGLQVWDWDLVTNTLKFDRNVMDDYGGDVAEAERNPGDFIARAVHPEDIARYRREFVRALKGEAPLCIDYRVLHKDGTCYPMQLRGQVFRGPIVGGLPSRATRVVGFTIDMRSQLDSAKRIEKHHEHQQQLIERVALAADAAGIGVWDWDLKTDRLRSDTNMARIFDQADVDSIPSAREFTERIVHPEDFPDFYKAMENAVQHGDRVSHRYRHRHADGSLHHVQLHGRVIRDANKKPLRLLVITWDITKEVEAQSKIEQQAKQLQQWVDRIGLATETAGIGMWDWDLATGRLSSDTNMASIFRDANLSDIVNAQDFIARILHPDDRIPFSATMRAATRRNGDNRVSTAFRYLRTDGGVHHVELNGRIVRNAEGIAERFLGISWNVTAKIEAQAEIERQAGVQRALLERLNLATEVAGIDVWDWDIKSDHFTSDAHMTKAYGTTHIKANSGRELIKQIVHPDDIDKCLLEIDAAIASGQSLSHRYRMVLRDGTLKHVQAHGRVFRDDDGRAVRMLGVSLNVTDEVEHLNELRRQADEERALRDQLNLATKTAGIAIWDQDMISGGFTGDARFWELFGRDGPVANFRVQDGIYPDERQSALAPIYAAFTDPTQNEVLSIRHRTLNPKRDLQYVQSHMRLFRDAEGKPANILGVTWDVTDEMQANAALKHQADKERALVERLNVATQAAGISPWEFDLKSGQFSWHGLRPACFGLDHVPLEDYYNAIVAIVLPEDRHLMFEPAKEAIENNRDSYEYRFRVNGVDGKLHYIQNYARVLRNERGKIRYCVGVTWDVTKEVEAAEQLRSQAELERALVDRLNVATQAAGISPWEFDLVANRFVWFGIRLNVLGLDDEPLETYFEALRNIVIEEDRHVLAGAPTQALKEGVDVYSYRYRANGTDGQVHHLKNFVRVLRSPRGTPYRLVGVTWDISEEVAANDLLQTQAEHERTLVARLNVATQAAGISPWEFDLKTNKYNWFGTRMTALGLDDEPLDTYYDAIRDILVPEDRDVLHDAALEAITNGIDMYSALYRANGIDGKIHYLKNFVRVLRSPRGTPYRLVGVTWDTSEEVAANELLQQQAEHERALTDRLNVATQAAGISPWEFDLVARKLTWLGVELKALGLEGVPVDQYMDALHKTILPEDLPILTQAAEEAVASGAEVYSYRYRANGIDGAVHHMKNFVRIQRSARGRPIKLVGVTWDISEEVAASERLEEQVQHAHALKERLGIATMAAGISPFEIDLINGKFLWIENPIKALAGTSGTEGKLTTYSQRIHPEDVNNFRDEIVRAAKGGYDVITYRYRGIASDGSIVNVQTHAKLFFNEQRRATRALGVSWDVTEEIAAAAQLQLQAEHERKLLERLNIATDSAGISSWEIDLVTGKFLWIENPLKSVEHADDESLDLAHFSERIVVEDRGLMQQEIRKALKSNSDRIGFRYRANGNDGEIAHVQTFARLIVNESGRPVRVLGVSWDVTREVEAAEQLRHQTERLRDVERRLERASLSSSEGHWEAEMATGHLWCSSSFHALLGYLEGELEARVSAFDLLVHAEDHAIYHEALRKHLVQSTPYNVETRLRMASGEYRWFRMRGMAERNTEGQPTVMAGSIHDVHQQKLAEDALDMAQRRFERAINGTQDGLWELDVSNQTAWVSPRLAMLLGYPIAELETRNFLRTLIHPDDAAKVAKVTESHYRHNSPFDLELRLQTRSGEHRWYRARASAERDSNGRAVRLSGSLQDVTEAREAREELVHATEAAESASRAKSAFLANVSHEIRTPMNGIIGMTGLLIDTQLDRTQRDYANTIRGSADSLLTVINDILDFSKIEAGKLDLESIEMDLRANVEDVGAMMAFQAANKGLELIINVHPEVPERVLGDPQRIRQCLVNLLGNAIKFTKQGEIVIDVCVVGRHEGKVLTHFEVRDTGMGIPDATLKTLFQPFVQADSSTTRHFGGTGLGLSIVRRLVEMMGGQVGVVSKVGEGSNFFFTLSLEPKEDPIAINIQNADRNAHILVVDDNATNRRVLDGLLTHQGYQVTCVDSGAAALESLKTASVQGRHNKFDIVITDFQMPDMDGVMLGEQITRDPSLARLRIIMLTSLDRQGDSKHLASLGFAAYLTKPVRTRELLECVTHVLSRETRQTEMRPMLTRNSLLQAQPQQKFAGHVLLVEDNLVNQKVAARFLERMGCTVHIAGHGADGVAMFKEKQFDAVLMDLQMPVMDGLTATRAIRDLEAGTSRRVPIIALTANAMRGDKERCEDAGMDGFLTKPIEVERLRDTLAKFGLGANSKAAQSEAMAVSELLERSVPAALPPIDLARLNEITGGDPEFAKELIETFIVSCEAQILEIHDAIGAADNRSLARSAHKLKGACANFHAEEMRLLVARLESEALTTNVADLLACNTQLQQAFARAKEFLNNSSVVPANVKAAS